MVFRAKELSFLGIAHFLIGFLMIVLAIASFVSFQHWTSHIGSGIWVGVWVGLTGLFAFLVEKHNRLNKCLVGVMLGFAVTACVLSGAMLILYSFALHDFAQRLRCPKYIVSPTPSNRNSHYDRCYFYFSYDYSGIARSYSNAQIGAAIGSLLLILALVEFFVALATSIYGCNACCCTTPADQQPGGNVIVLNPHGSVNPGATFQTMVPFQGQFLPGVPTGQPQTYITSPQGVIQQGQPVQQGQPYQAYPAYTQLDTGGAFGVQLPGEALQEPQSK